VILSDIATWYRRVLSGDELVGSYRSRSSVVCLGAGLIATLDGVKRLTRMIVFFFNNLMHKFIILIHLLYSSTCFEHYYAHLQEDKLC